MTIVRTECTKIGKAKKFLRGFGEWTRDTNEGITERVACTGRPWKDLPGWQRGLV
jgi:hypothetical protein